ncbi:MAG TPA: aminoacyl-histidine dipeptidase [Bacteroidetes bacterium]|nr:MAG: aminoacyl-histidine dipeptidase [Ignavibacteria bacterium GWA2_54_16]HCA81548.1 aminoacyl-histidine dipeptidase [Bacteroidota bacterium]
MANPIEGLKPEGVWKYFAEISKIPRGSKNEKQIAAYVMQKAKEFGLEAKQDKFMTVVVRKPATPGYENRPMICLQGHLDMVCEKNKDKVHDFEKDPIELVRDGNIMKANGTTLGADNGVAVATNLAIMEDKSLVHGPLEFLFTIDEETGLTGASNLKPGFIQSKILMNLDSEEEGELYVGCSGGKNTIGVWKAAFENSPGKSVAAALHVKGLKGGHSGLEIDKGRGNSLKIINRALLALTDIGARLASIEGGNKSNAIPREAEALVFLPAAKLNQAKKVVAAFNTVAKAELASVEPDLVVELEVKKDLKKGKVIKKQQQALLLKTIAGLPHGVIKMSADIAGLVETSTNVAVIRTEKGKITLTTSQRSSVASEILEICQSVVSVFELGGAKVQTTEGYPGWKPNLASPILKQAKATYQQLYGKEPAVKAIHAGLECGIIGEKYPGMDMVSFGPTLQAVHSPDEKIYIDTVDKFWKFLLGILKNVN